MSPQREKTEMSPAAAPVSARAGERGSAYIMALLVLVVLTIAGLSLVYITQTEMEIGANERTLQRTLYEADSGIAIATARVLVTNEHRSATFDLAEETASPILNIKNRVELSSVVPLNDTPCNLCEVNNAGTYNERAYRRINHVITVRATRVGGADEKPLGQRIVSSMIEVQPWKSVPEAYAAVGNPDEMKKIKF
jgi:Tfp pilus assembly protein PilX